MSGTETAVQPERCAAEEERPLSEAEMDQLSADELLAVYKRTGDERYKWPLVLRYEPLIRNVALQIRGVYSSFAEVNDIINEGILTLINAVDKFEPERGIKFETYVSKRIRGMVIDVARKQDWMPRNVRKRSKQINQAISELFSILGRFPTDSEIAGHLGISLEKYQKESANIALGNVLSLDGLIDMWSTEGGRFEIPSEDMQYQPEISYQEQELKETLARAIGQLQEKEQIVLSLYYEKNLRMREIAQVLDVSEGWVSQLRTHALQELRVYMNEYMSGTALHRSQKRKKE